jgi:hypothetical protein
MFLVFAGETYSKGREKGRERKKTKSSSFKSKRTMFEEFFSSLLMMLAGRPAASLD